MITRMEAVDQLSSLGIKSPYVYLIDLVALIEMIWADGELQEAELAILNEYLHKRVHQINEMAGYKVMDFEDAQAFAQRFIQQRPQAEFLSSVRSLIGPFILTSSDSSYVDSLLMSLLEACIDIAANAVRKYPYGLHDRFDADEKRCFAEIVKTFIDFKHPKG
jgi:outer membrane protein assembly factor BamD (BamD/ComL family)